MNNYKVLIMKYQLLYKEFEIYGVDFDTAKHIAESYVRYYFDTNYQILVLEIKE